MNVNSWAPDSRRVAFVSYRFASDPEALAHSSP
jgi:hypothetical protein